MKDKILILDCFVDEPACFGVPPFISPYPRYIAGALIEAGISHNNITYLTIDSPRLNNYILTEHYNSVFLIGGAVVPGRYLGAKIGTKKEINKIIENNPKEKFIIGGPVSTVIKEKKNVKIIKRDIERYAYNYIKEIEEDNYRSIEEISRWSLIGSFIVRQHPSFPEIICEIESYRGCPRTKHCSFCSEGLFKKIEFRTIRNIIDEVDSLIQHGVQRFRIGRQADILQYLSPLNEFKNGFSKPNPSAIKEFFGELQLRVEQKKIIKLNIDNANPGTIYNFPDESAEILKFITDAISPGDTLALGIESFDPNVIQKNNLKVLPNEAIDVIKLINDIGGRRKDGIPILLPGINLIQGLRGETIDTFKINFEYLKKILDLNLLVKRINIRKLMPFPGTELFSEKNKTKPNIINKFEYFRDKIRSEIDLEMLKRIYPIGTTIKENIILDKNNGYSYGKEIASYSITVKIPVELEEKNFYDTIIVSHGSRSITGIPKSYNINNLPQKAIEKIPGIGKHMASEIILNRPFLNGDDFYSFIKQNNIVLNETIKNILANITLQNKN